MYINPPFIDTFQKHVDESPKTLTHMKTITITIPEGKKAEWVNGVLTLTTEDVTDRIKTFDDALKELGGDHPFVQEYHRLTINGAPSVDVRAYLKLRIVCAALNEGWEPQFTEDERRWNPWHWLYGQEEIDEMDEQEKTVIHTISAGPYHTEYAEIAYLRSGFSAGCASADIGSRLCLKTEELSDYCGKQFIHLWADFKLIRK